MKCVCGAAESVLYYDAIEQKQQYLGKNFNKKPLTRFKALENLWILLEFVKDWTRTQQGHSEEDGTAEMLSEKTPATNSSKTEAG